MTKGKKKGSHKESTSYPMFKIQQIKPDFLNYHLYSNRSKLITGLDIFLVSDFTKPPLHLLKCTPQTVEILANRSITKYFSINPCINIIIVKSALTLVMDSQELY